MIMGEVKPKIIISKEWRLVGHHRQRQGQGAREPWPPQHFRPCLVYFFWSLIITHHSKIPCLFGTITHFPSLNIFHTICEPHTYHLVQLFFFFLLQYPNSPNLVKKRRKRRRSRNPEQTEPVKEEGKKEKKKRRRSNPGEERTEQPTQRRKEKKRVKRWSKGAAKYCLWIPYVCLITILPLNYELWKLKTAKICFQFP